MPCGIIFLKNRPVGKIESKKTVSNDPFLMMMCVILADLIYMLFFGEKFATLCNVVQRSTKDKCQPVFCADFFAWSNFTW